MSQPWILVICFYIRISFLLVCSLAVHWHQFLFYFFFVHDSLLTLQSSMKWISHRFFFFASRSFFTFKRWTFRFWFIAFWCNTLCALYIPHIKVIYNIKSDFWLWNRPAFFISLMLRVLCGFNCFTDPVGFHSSWIVTSSIFFL